MHKHPEDYLFHVYIAASRSRQLYIGMTNDLKLRMTQHREARPGTYTARYNINRLVYCERFQHVLNAIHREKELKDWSRSRKIELINLSNPSWEDLSANW